METLRWTRVMLTVCGCGLELYIYTPLRRFLYKIYEHAARMLFGSVLILQTLDILFIVENQEQFTENIAITSMTFNSFVKSIVMAANRTNILNLIKRLEENYFLPVGKDEMEIRSRFDKIIESTTKAYTTLLGFFVFWMMFAPIVIGFNKRRLAFRIWLPYNYSSASSYLLTSTYQIIVTCYGVSVTMACECLYTGLILYVCCQFEILEHRFRCLNGNAIYTVGQCAFHHHLIYKYAEAVNKEFKGIVSFQFFNSMSMICVTIYQLPYAENSTAFMGMAMFLMCVFLQIFYYCFLGNVVKEKSIVFPDEIFGSGWPSWNDSSKKVLLMVIRRSRTPIEFTSMHVVSLSLESFMSLLKTSYSAYNFMASTR